MILSPDEAHDCTAFDALMAEREANPKVMLADKGYDTDDIRGQLRARGAAPEIPTKRNRKNQHTVNRALYAMRNKIERFFNRLKESRRVATRYDHKADSFLGFAKLASIKLWIRFVHAALDHRLIMAHPDARGGKFDEAEIVEVVFLEPRGDRAEMLELSEEALDQISVAVEP